MNESLIKTNNELIRQRRKKIFIKKLFIITLFLLSILVILCLKLPYFNIADIEVQGNNSISSNEIIKLSKVYKGNNIFYLNEKRVKTNIMSNPYILDVNISRKFPKTIVIDVKEREAVFFSKLNNSYYIIDNHGILLEKRENLNNMNVIELNGLDISKASIGKVIPSSDNRRIQAVADITDLILRNQSNFKITSVDLRNLIDIKIYFKNMCIKIGTSSGLKDKLNEAINIMTSNNLRDAKGYIDVSFDGNPVVHVEK